MAHRSLIACVLWSFASCKGNDDTGADDDPGDSDGPLSFEFTDRVPAQEFDSRIADSALAAHQTGNMLLASTGIVVADEKVQDRLNIEGAGGLDFRAGGLDCWAREPYPMFSFPIDYSGCSAYQMAGGVFVADHPTGPLLFEFQNFQITDRSIGGVLALDREGAFADPLYWQAYNSDSLNPGLDNRVPIGINVDSGNYGISWTGGASVDFVAQEWAMWGVMDFTFGTEPVQVIYGGLDPADVPADDPPGADVLKSSLNWLECRCPQSGLSFMAMPLQVEAVTLDIDSFELEPDAVDDPTISMEVDALLDGDATLTWTGCGSWDVAYATAAAEIIVSRDQLTGVLSFACETLAIPDTERCDAMVDAAARLPSTFTVEITEQQVTSSAKEAADNEFDNAWCHLY